MDVSVLAYYMENCVWVTARKAMLPALNGKSIRWKFQINQCRMIISH